MKKRLITTAILALALVFGFGGASWGQQGKGQTTKDDFGMSMGMGGGMGHGMRMFKGLNLSAQQQKQVKTVIDKHQTEMQALDEKIDAARKSVHEAMHADTFNEQAIRNAHKTLAAEMENMSVLRGKIFSEIRPILTPEQVTQLKTMPRRHMEKMGGRPECPMMKGMK